MTRQLRAAGIVSHLIDGRRNPIFHLFVGVGGEGVAKVLNNVKTVSTADHTQPDYVVGRVEQVGAMRG